MTSQKTLSDVKSSTSPLLSLGNTAFRIENHVPSLLANDPTILAMKKAVEEFERLVTNFVAAPVRKIKESTWLDFYKLSEDVRWAKIAYVEDQSNFIRKAIEAGHGGKGEYNEIKMFGFALKHFNLLFSSDFLDRIKNGNLIEIYDEDYIQRYRSYSFFGVCNYSILELSTYPWYELYERPSQITQALLGYAAELMEGKSSFISLEGKVPEHILQEKFTDERAAFMISDSFLAKTKSTLTGLSYMIVVKNATEVQAKREIGSGEIRFL